VGRLSNHRTTVSVLRHAATTLVATSSAAENWKLNSLETHESLSDIIVSGGVNSATLSIAEELVQCVVSRTLPDLVVVVELLVLGDCIVNGPIGRVLWWAAVKASRSTSWMLLTVTTIGTKRTVRILVSTRCSGKRLQVSDHCSTPVRY